MTLEQGAVWLAAGVRTPFANVDGALANCDAGRPVGAGGSGDGVTRERPDRLRCLGLGGAESQLRQSGARDLV